MQIQSIEVFKCECRERKTVNSRHQLHAIEVLLLLPYEYTCIQTKAIQKEKLQETEKEKNAARKTGDSIRGFFLYTKIFVLQLNFR